jgi:tRNA modification GTPase
MRDTIYAAASGVGRVALTVLRISGPGCGAVVERLAGALPPPRHAALRRLRSPDGTLLDHALVLWFPSPASYTGEDCAELHLHGGFAVLAGVGDALTALGARPAEPGEFTRRAVSEGKMDLLEAEAVIDLIDAETGAQREQALRHLSGEMSDVAQSWREDLLRLLAWQEALIDFPDEDLPEETEGKIRAGIEALLGRLRSNLVEGARGEKLRSGLVFAIAGPPNAGKSTLLNALCQRDVAIVSPLAGTTRDVLEARIVLGGIPVTLLDTAGLRESDDPIEAEGVRRALARVAEADLVIALASPSELTCVASDARVLAVATKSDLLPGAAGLGLAVSALTGAGMTELVAVLTLEAQRMAGLAATPTITRERHRAALREAIGHLEHALTAPWPELRGESLRLAMRGIGRLTGMVGVEEVLDSIFGQFCIGK